MSREVPNALTGKWFHAVKPDRQTITWQGQILELVSPGVYRVQLVELSNPGPCYRPCQQRLVAASDMRFWIIFDTQEEMIGAYLDYKRHAQATNVTPVAQAAQKASETAMTPKADM